MKRFITDKYVIIFITFLFFTAYSLISLIKHYHFLSGYDLAIIDQVIWKYSQFKQPITTIHAYYGTSLLQDHVEILYILLSPIYWIFSSVYTLLLLQIVAIVSSAYAIFYFARAKKISLLISSVLTISYLSFYGIQFAIYSDVHSLVFGISFLAWFLYFLEKNNLRLTLLFFLLSIFCKEDMALLTLLVSVVYYFYSRKKTAIMYVLLSIIYLLFIFFIYYPFMTHDGYRYANPNGLLHDLNPLYMIDTIEKKKVFFYSFASFGFIPLLLPTYLIPTLGDLAHYFVLGNSVVTSAQGLFMHYRSSLALLLVWPTIMVFAKYKFLQNKYIALYLLACTAFVQYSLHLPLSYLTKQWFWTAPPAVSTINTILEYIPHNASLATQNNIAPHVTHRDSISIIWPETKAFAVNSPCGQPNCDWFRWEGSPQFLLVDTSPEWDTRHLLTNNEEFKNGVVNLEKMKVISVYKKNESTVLYKINIQPQTVK